MVCRIADLRFKEVVNINNGACLGVVSDIEIDTCCARVQAIIIYGRPKCFGLLGREDDVVICWENIQCIGEDTVLVRYCQQPRCNKPQPSLFERLFG